MKHEAAHRPVPHHTCRAMDRDSRHNLRWSGRELHKLKEAPI